MTRLVTFVDIDDQVADVRQVSVSARHEALLANGRHVLLLDDRGWGASGPSDIWARTSVEDIVDAARMVVGPDESSGGRSHEDLEADHWAQLTDVLRQRGIQADALELKGHRTKSSSASDCLRASAIIQATPSGRSAAPCRRPRPPSLSAQDVGRCRPGHDRSG